MQTRIEVFVMAIGLLAAAVLATGGLIPMLRRSHGTSVTVSMPLNLVLPADAPKMPPQETDPVAGRWLLEGRSLLTLESDHTITGDRHGFWRYTCTTNGGRNYELHWKLPKDWVDYLVLSGDGKNMAGKTRNNWAISYYRP